MGGIVGINHADLRRARCRYFSAKVQYSCVFLMNALDMPVPVVVLEELEIVARLEWVAYDQARRADRNPITRSIFNTSSDSMLAVGTPRATRPVPILARVASQLLVQVPRA